MLLRACIISSRCCNMQARRSLGRLLPSGDRVRPALRALSIDLQYSRRFQRYGTDQSDPQNARKPRGPRVLVDTQLSFTVPKQTHQIQNLCEDDLGKEVVLHGYLGARNDLSKNISFVPLISADLASSVQLISVANSGEVDSPQCHATLKSQTAHSPVAVSGVVQRKEKSKKAESARTIPLHENVEVKITGIDVFNSFPANVTFEHDTAIPPEQRHLQLRQSAELRRALRLRAETVQHCQRYLANEQGFLEVETPLLFKSTPEGAREFIVPTRRKGHVYALPQSPQQYKQILMASGIPRYFQFAKCFRDEDLRADRQPEFTQLDMEMAFATGADVMDCVEELIRSIWRQVLSSPIPSEQFPTISYNDAMGRYGSDKPDTRLGMEIIRIGHMIPVDLVTKIGPLTEPVVEAFKFSVSDEPPETRKFIAGFMDSPEAQPFLKNPDGQPGIFIFDPRKPLSGLQPFGFEAAEQIEETLSLEEGDIVVIQARSDAPFSGGSTMLGNLRTALHRAAVANNLIDPPTGWSFLWVNDFPLFSPSTGNADEPGQGGATGLSSTHHPFTAPASAEDLALLSTSHLDARADHYDLVLNGVELGGGSRRIHDPKLQEYVLREVLGMSEERMSDFAHLLDVLGSGCPPHAGIALGFDRLCAVMLGKESIRDVIAFPKSGRGEDPLVKSPGLVTKDQLETYHLRLSDN